MEKVAGASPATAVPGSARVILPGRTLHLGARQAHQLTEARVAVAAEPRQGPELGRVHAAVGEHVVARVRAHDARHDQRGLSELDLALEAALEAHGRLR